jgi:hypothetical protein
MSKVVYTGPQPARTVVLPEGGTVLAEKGKGVEVPTEVAKELVKQEDWSKYGQASKKKSSSTSSAKTSASGDATPTAGESAGNSNNPEA